MMMTPEHAIVSEESLSSFGSGQSGKFRQIPPSEARPVMMAKPGQACKELESFTHPLHIEKVTVIFSFKSIQEPY